MRFLYEFDPNGCECATVRECAASAACPVCAVRKARAGRFSGISCFFGTKRMSIETAERTLQGKTGIRLCPEEAIKSRKFRYFPKLVVRDKEVQMRRGIAWILSVTAVGLLTPAAFGQNPYPYGPMPAQYGPMPGQYGPMPGQYPPMQPQFGPMPAQYGPLPGQYPPMPA